MRKNTSSQFDDVIAACRSLFEQKTADYGTSWRVLRLPSLTDQIFIKAQRIRNIQDLGTQKIDDDIEGEFIGIVNYGIIAVIQINLPENTEMELSVEELMPVYDEQVRITKELMEAKNHDYGEAWRDMRVGSFVDLILMRIQRLKQIENNDGKTVVSEGTESHYRDIVNYGIFALIKLSEAAYEDHS